MQEIFNMKKNTFPLVTNVLKTLNMVILFNSSLMLFSLGLVRVNLLR